EIVRPCGEQRRAAQLAPPGMVEAVPSPGTDVLAAALARLDVGFLHEQKVQRPLEGRRVVAELFGPRALRTALRGAGRSHQDVPPDQSIRERLDRQARSILRHGRSDVPEGVLDALDVQTVDGDEAERRDREGERLAGVELEEDATVVANPDLGR